MNASKRFEKLYKLERTKYAVKTILFLVSPAILITYLITQNYPSEHISTQTAVVTYVASTSTNAETGGAGGQPISILTVELATGNKTQINVFNSSIIKAGDTVFVNTYKNNISGISYLFGGLKKNEN